MYCTNTLRRSGTASTGNDGGTKRRGFRSKIEITPRRTTHEGLKVSPNAPHGLVKKPPRRLQSTSFTNSCVILNAPACGWQTAKNGWMKKVPILEKRKNKYRLIIKNTHHRVPRSQRTKNLQGPTRRPKELTSGDPL